MDWAKKATERLDDEIRLHENGAMLMRYPIYLVPTYVCNAVIERAKVCGLPQHMVPYIMWKGKYLIPISIDIIIPVNDMELANRLRIQNELIIDKIMQNETNLKGE